MNIVRSIFGEIRFKDKASNAINKVDRKMDSSKAKAVGMQNALQAVGGAVFIKKTIDVVGNLINLSAAFEQTKISFEVMLGSAEKSAAMVKQLDEFSNLTPFTPEAVNENAKMLLNFGIAADKVLPSLQMLGDVSGGNAEKFGRLSLAFGQVSSQGRLMGQDLLQMINAGFNPLQELSVITGKSMKQLKDEMSKGLVSFDMVQAAFARATGEGGKFYQMMVKQSETWAGLQSTFQGLRNAALREIGGIITSALKPLLKHLIEATRWFVEFAKSEKGIRILKIALIALIPIVGTLLLGSLIAVISAIGGFVIAAAPLLATILPVIAALTALALILEDLWVGLHGGESVIYEFFKPFYDWVERVTESIQNLNKSMDSLIDKIPLIGRFNKWSKEMTRISATKQGGVVGSRAEIRVVQRIGSLKRKKNREGLSPKEQQEIYDLESEYKSLRKKATGGAVKAGEPYLVGEKGAELFSPRESGFITPNDLLSDISLNVKPIDILTDMQTPVNKTTFTIDSLVGEINITVQNTKEGAEKIKETVLDALNDLSRNYFPTETGVPI